MSVTHTRPTVGSKRCGYDQRARSKQLNPTQYSRLCTHKAPPTALESALNQCSTLVKFSPFAEGCPYRDILALEVEKGTEGLISHYGSEALALKALERWYKAAQKASNDERFKRKREQKRKVQQEERRKPLQHKLDLTIR